METKTYITEELAKALWEYKGEWVALAHGAVLAHGATLEAVADEVGEQGAENFVFHLVPEHQLVAYEN